MEHRIFLTDLHVYNNGALIGDWVNIEEFDRQKHNFGEICRRCGIKDGHEFFISDWESPFNIGEYCDVEDLYRISDLLKAPLLDDDEINAVCECTDDLDEQIQHLEDRDFVFYKDDRPSARNLGVILMEEFGELKSNDWKSDYFDYERFGEDLLSDDWEQLKHGYIRFDN
jgi:hypothetical protein